MVDKLKILVVEDNPRHIESARKTLAGKAELDFVGNYKDFIEKIKTAENFCFPYKGVLSDIFFPTDDLYFKDHCVPAGIGVYIICKKLYIPCVLVTAGHHHGKDYEWIGMTLGKLLTKGNTWPLVDGDVHGTFGSKELDVEAPEKNWALGFNELLEMRS